MAEESFDEKTEEPTSKRLEDAREEGNIPKSQEINSAIVLLLSFIILYLYSQMFFDYTKQSIVSFYNYIGNFDKTTSLDLTMLMEILISMSKYFLILVGPFMGAIVVIGVLVNVLQVGINFIAKPLIPDLNKINPLKGIKNLFSKKSLFELAKNLVKLFIVTFVTYKVLKDEIAKIPMYSDLEVIQIFEIICKLSIKVVFYIIFVYIILAIIDLIYQRYDFKKNLMMTKQEVKEESKMTDGNPEIKSRIKQVQYEMAKKRMMQDVPDSTVVITNPTFIAIAIKYSAGMIAPIVVAKGKRTIAQKIRDVAKESGVPIVENKPLARAMYDLVEVSDEIPHEFYEVIAEIIAYVYSLEKNYS